MKVIDVNADIGEGFGIYKVCDDEKLMSFISSASIACGFHAGDPTIMSRMVKLAKKYGIGIGAHVSLFDLQGFGRRKIDVSPDEVFEITLYQLGALYSIAKSHNAKLQHIKLHGWLYHLANDNQKISESVANAIKKFDKNLFWIGYPDSFQEKIANEYKIKFAPEAFADRVYDKTGRLIPRAIPESLIKLPEDAVQQTLNIVLKNKVKTISGDEIAIKAKTICIHSDSPQAIEIASSVRKGLEASGVNIKPLSL